MSMSTNNEKQIGLGLKARVATAEYMKPVCIEPRDGRDESMSVTVYEHEGAIVGVVVMAAVDGTRTLELARIGLTPTDEDGGFRDA